MIRLLALFIIDLYLCSLYCNLFLFTFCFFVLGCFVGAFGGLVVFLGGFMFFGGVCLLFFYGCYNFLLFI